MGNLPIGQGELVTPMQMATAYAAIANGGILRRPHIVSAIDGRPRPRAGRAARDLRRRPPPRCGRCSKGVLGPGGTASEVSIPGYELAGKTGTASKIDPADRRILRNRLRRLVHRLRPGDRPEAAVRGGRRRTAERLDLRRHGRRARLRADHELRPALPGHPPGVGDGRAPGPRESDRRARSGWNGN